MRMSGGAEAPSFRPTSAAERLASALYGLAPAVGTGLAYMLGGTILSKLGAAEWVALGPFGLVRPWQAAFVLVGCLGGHRRRAVGIDVLLSSVVGSLGHMVRDGLARRWPPQGLYTMDDDLRSGASPC
jgi:hypothetical protein